jgi:predicted transcriptional regulator
MPRPLTLAELEVMSALWDLGEATVHEMLARLGSDRAYNTVSTLVRILEQKGFVRSRKNGRRHLYRAATRKPDYQKATLRDLVRRLFSGDAGALVRTLLSTNELPPDEIAELRRLLRRKERG